jgi:hypothetical protein
LLLPNASTAVTSVPGLSYLIAAEAHDQSLSIKMGHIPEPARTTIIVSTIILFIAWVAVALRFYIRWVTKLGIAADDWWILAGIILSFITGTTYLYGISPSFHWSHIELSSKVN